MAVPSEELQTLRDALVKARARGIRKTEIEGMSVEYRSDAEMAAAIADLDRRLAASQAARPATIAFSASKGI
ncbi:phage head-tail joining protein [Mesobacterium pallidum]|uniref:phage head-tail joining protein n=1 Tax=Mesobacterium pallidum TaxID=2872037 RepID=UPI001EE2BAE8|nr:hypothetical protein [Mesobacterium pallidum]